MPGDPLVTVLMPVCNGEPHLREAIRSILGQTFREFEFLILDDGSTDRSVEIVRSHHDPRIRLLRNERNLGVARTLNRGLEAARGDYVARMDSDDRSVPERLERQLAFFRRHPGLGLCGGWIRTFGGPGPARVFPVPPDHEQIRAGCLLGCPVAHPTVMLDSSLFRKHGLQYDPACTHAEDYELWTRAGNLLPLANLQEVLLEHREHPGQVSRTCSETQGEMSRRIRLRLLRGIGIEPGGEEIELHERAVALAGPWGWDSAARLDAWFSRIVAANRDRRMYEEAALVRTLAARWLDVLRRIDRRELGFDLRKSFLASPLSQALARNDRGKFSWRCLRYGVKNFFRGRRQARAVSGE
jgi:glycosyltransferase involved in cell wall biosynthesis